MSGGVDHMAPGQDGDSLQESAMELALAAALGPEHVAPGLRAWRSAPDDGTSASLTMTAAWVCTQLGVPERQQALYLALLRHRMKLVATGQRSAPAVKAPAPATETPVAGSPESAVDLPALALTYAEALSVEAGKPPEEIIESGLLHTARTRGEANTWRHWLRHSRTTGNTPSVEDGRRLLNGLWQEGCELVGPVLADLLLGNAVRRLDSERPADGTSLRRYL